MRIIVLGLRRSGTTVFWEAFRGDARLVCFNEPLNPVLRELPAEIPNRSREEFIDVFRRDPDEFWRRFAPIGRVEELQEGFADRQLDYLRFLDSASERGLCFDTTRCHFKIRALRELWPDAVLVHLHRHPAAFASSHLVPTGSGGFRGGWWRQAWGRRGFWTRRDRYNNWGLQELIGSHPESLFGRRLGEVGIDAEAVYGLPAVGRLLAYWHLHWRRAESDGPAQFGERFVSVALEEFCAEPRRTLERVYAAAGETPSAVDLSRVHPAKPAHQPDHPSWARYCEAVGLPAAGRPAA